jgi:hypothetical protein
MRCAVSDGEIVDVFGFQESCGLAVRAPAVPTGPGSDSTGLRDPYGFEAILAAHGP